MRTRTRVVKGGVFNLRFPLGKYQGDIEKQKEELELSQRKLVQYNLFERERD